MTMFDISNYLDNKIADTEDFIRIPFYDMRVKYNLSTEETDTFLKLAKNKFENLGYKVYFTGAKFKYKDVNMTVQSNELMVAIKEKEWGK